VFQSRTATSVICTYTGTNPRLCDSLLRIRVDRPCAVIADAAATLQLAGRLSSDIEVVCLDARRSAKCTGLLDVLPQSKFMGLRLKECNPPPEWRDGPVIALELQPGSGLLDLYGRPSLFKVQDESRLKLGEMARAGSFNPQDLYSGRPDRVRRALGALTVHPDRSILRVMVDGQDVLQESEEGSAAAALQDSLQQAKVANLGDLMEILAMKLDAEGRELLATLLRAQCAAVGGAATFAQQLWEVLQQKTNAPVLSDELLSQEAIRLALQRGFWTLPADGSGKSQREREGDRLLERARRELWTEGSASRLELEAQIRNYLCRHLLGCAAVRARLRLKIVRASKSAEAADGFRRLGYAPVGVAPGCWCKLELLDLEVPLKPSIGVDR